jgi:Undecaprenyl-phosphate galactose phosphotransferase WbaP
MNVAAKKMHPGVAAPYEGWGDGGDGAATAMDPPARVLGAPWVAPTLGRWPVAGLWVRRGLFFLTDLTALVLAFSIVEGVWTAGMSGPSPLGAALYVSAGLLCIAAYGAGGLYAAFPVTPVEEVRATVAAATAVFAALVTAVVALLGDGAASLALMAVWGLLIGFTPLLRAALRALCAERSWWGCPVVVLGAGGAARRVVRTLQLQPELGIRPVAVLHDDPAERSRIADLTGVSAPGGLALASRLATRGLPYAVLAFPPAEAGDLARVIDRHGRLFRRLLVVPDFDGVASLWVGARDVGGVVGIEVQHRLLVSWKRWLKRSVDVAVAAAGMTVLAPLLLLIGALIKLDSEGPVFYAQDRLGRGGRCFRILKFRTMYVGAHERLRAVLERDPAARAEYEHYAKLTNDPRVTRVGRVLRRCSLDELPQLINVLLGQMSLVGPRAYLPEELPRMLGKHQSILHVVPGITGLWQVSGRNELPFAMRLDLDLRYVRNWSVSLDLYLLTRTVPTVLLRRGAG